MTFYLVVRNHQLVLLHLILTLEKHPLSFLNVIIQQMIFLHPNRKKGIHHPSQRERMIQFHRVSDEPTDRNADDPYTYDDGTILRPGDEVGSLFKVDPTLAARIRSLTESGYGDEDLFAADTLVINRTELTESTAATLLPLLSIPTIINLDLDLDMMLDKSYIVKLK